MQHTEQKKTVTTNNLFIIDNNKHILAISENIAGNHHDAYKITEYFETMTAHFKEKGLLQKGQYLNADPGFDAKKFRKQLEEKGYTANIKENKRNQKLALNQYIFNKEVYKTRLKIEHVFAHLDNYRRILVRFEVLSICFKAWLFLAAFLHNCRHFFKFIAY